MKHAQDHFSPIAPQYAKGRIGYPDELYRFLAAQCRCHQLAWDCATGSGQAALDLARIFSKVIATDISEELLALSPSHPQISFRTAAAEDSGLEPESIDLVTVAQAVHWFDHARFLDEVLRVLKQGGVLAFWGYNWPVAGTEVNHVLEDFKAAISSSWPARSAILHDGYRAIHPPLSEIQSPAIEVSVLWEVEDYLSHLRSWSGARYFQERTGEDIVKKFSDAFGGAWSGGQVRVRWPLIVRVFRKE